MNRLAGRRLAENAARPPSVLERAALAVFIAAVRLYPRRFAATFGEEVVEVFQMAITEAAAAGTIPLLRALGRELAELPLALFSRHIEERKGTMTLLNMATAREIRLGRWLARMLSLLLALFALSLLLFNEDVRANPTLPTLVFGALTLGSLIAWRWEKAGGLGVMLASPLLVLSIWLHWAGVDATVLMPPRWTLVMLGAGASIGFAALGWLFLSVGQHAGTAGQAPDVPRDRRRSLVAIAVLSAAALVLLLAPVLLPVGQSVEFSGETGLPAAYEPAMIRLRAAGAVVGVGSPPILHPELDVEGVTLDVDGATIYAFAFTDVPAAEAAVNRVADGLGRSFRHGAVLFFYGGTEPGTLAILERAFGPALDDR